MDAGGRRNHCTGHEVAAPAAGRRSRLAGSGGPRPVRHRSYLSPDDQCRRPMARLRRRATSVGTVARGLADYLLLASLGAMANLLSLGKEDRVLADVGREIGHALQVPAHE